ncbi:hypothetical protein DFAR_1830003 [Desulfarculales bacterium]
MGRRTPQPAYQRTTVVGKSFLACALGHQVSLEGYSIFCKKGPAILREMLAARGDSGYHKNDRR